MAKGIKLKRSRRPGQSQASLYDEVDDNASGLPHQQFMSQEAASLRLRRELMDSDGDANLAHYNAAFRASIEKPDTFTATANRFAEEHEVSDDLAFCKQLDEELATLEQTLADHINNHTATHTEINRLVNVYLERLTEQFQDHQEAEYQKIPKTLIQTYVYDPSDLAAIRRLDPTSAALRHINSVRGYLSNKVADTRHLHDDLRFTAPLDTTVLYDPSKVSTDAITARAAVSRNNNDIPTGYRVGTNTDIDNILRDQVITARQADVKAIADLNRRYELDLHRAMSDLDNGMLTIHNLNVVHEAYQKAILDKLDAFKQTHGVALERDPADVASHPGPDDASLYAQQRFAEIRRRSAELRVSENQQFMAPKSTLQHFRYDWDQDQKSKYDAATAGKVDTFKKNVDTYHTALQAVRPAVTNPPPLASFAAVVQTPPVLPAELETKPVGVFHGSGMAGFIEATPKEKEGQYKALNSRINVLRSPIDSDTEIAALEKAYLDSCQAYVSQYSPAAVAARTPTADQQVDALQSRLVALATASQTTPYDAVARAAQAKAIGDELAALRPGVPTEYALRSLAAATDIAAAHANSFVRVTTPGKGTDPATQAVYWVDATGAATLNADAAKDVGLLKQFPAVGEPAAKVPALTVAKYLLVTPDQTLATKIDTALQEVADVQAYYPVERQFQAITDELTALHADYATQARVLLDIEFNYEPTSAQQQLKDLSEAYQAKCTAASAKLTRFKEQFSAGSTTTPAGLNEAQKKAFLDQCTALEKTQKDHVAGVIAEVQKLREAADTSFERFNRNYQWDRLLQDPFNEERHHTLTQEQKKKLLDKSSDPEEILKRLLPAGGDADLQVGYMTLRRNADGSFDIDLSDAFSGKGKMYEYGHEGKVSFATAIHRWLSGGQRSQDIEATLTDTRRLDNLGLVLQAIKKDNFIYHHCAEYDKDAYNKMKAIFLAAKAQGISYDLDACFANSFNYRHSWFHKGMKAPLSREEKAGLREQMRKELAQYDNQAKATIAINQACRDFAVKGMQAGSPTVPALQGKDQNSKDFITAALNLSHAETCLKGQLPPLEGGKVLTQAQIDGRVAAVQASLTQMRNLNLKMVSGIAPAGGNYNGSAAAMLGLALERDHFAALLDLKKQELVAIHAEINQLEATGNPDAWSDELASLRQQAASATRTLNQEVVHFDLLCRQHGCEFDRSGRTVPNQLGDRRAELERREPTVFGQDKKNAGEIETKLSTLNFTDPKVGFATVKQQSEALEELEKSHALARSTGQPLEKTLLEHMVTSAELAQPEKFINIALKQFEDRAETVEARLCAARQDIATIVDKGEKDLREAREALALLPDTADKTAAEAKVKQLETAQKSGFLQAHLADVQAVVVAAKGDVKTDPDVKTVETLLQYQQLDKDLLAARATVIAAEVQHNHLKLKDTSLMPKGEVEAHNKAITAAELKVKEAKAAVVPIENKIKALDKPQCLQELCLTLGEAQAKLKTAQPAQAASATTALAAQAKAIYGETGGVTNKPQSDPIVLNAIKTATLDARLAKIADIHQSIIDLRALVTVTPQQADEKRVLLKSAEMQYHEIIDSTKRDVLATIHNDVQTPTDKIAKLATAAAILDHTDPAIRTHAADDRKVMAMAQSEVIDLKAERRNTVFASGKQVSDAYAVRLQNIVNPPSTDNALTRLKKAMSGTVTPAFGDRHGVFSSAPATTNAMNALKNLNVLVNEIAVRLKATGPTVPTPTEQKALQATLNEVQRYRTALVNGLKTDAARVLWQGTYEECQRVKSTFSSDKTAGYGLGDEKMPVSQAMAAKVTPKTIEALIADKITLGPDKVDALKTTVEPTTNRRA